MQPPANVRRAVPPPASEPRPEPQSEAPVATPDLFGVPARAAGAYGVTRGLGLLLGHLGAVGVVCLMLWQTTSFTIPGLTKAWQLEMGKDRDLHQQQLEALRAHGESQVRDIASLVAENRKSAALNMEFIERSQLTIAGTQADLQKAVRDLVASANALKDAAERLERLMKRASALSVDGGFEP